MPGKTQLLIESLTPERVPDKLAKEWIPVFFARKAQKNAIIIEVASKDLEKVFAILRGSCYNIKKVRFRGLGLLYKKCVEAVGLIIGAGLFAALVIGAQSRVLKIEVVGSGSYYESAILSVLDRGGVKKFGKAPESTALLSAEILSFPRVSYCAMNFKGGILTVEVRSEEEYSALSAYPLLSPAAGTVEELVVVRGTPRASVGDVVEAEQLLVEGISVYGEETREVIVIARVKIAFSVSETFEGSEQQALRSAYLKYGEIRDLKAEPAEGGFTVSGTAFAERSVNLGWNYGFSGKLWKTAAPKRGGGKTTVKTVTVETGGADMLQRVLGIFDENLAVISRELSLASHVDGTKIVFEGENAEIGGEVIQSLLSIAEIGENIDKGNLLYCIELAKEGRAGDVKGMMSDVVAVTSRGKPVKCKTVGQKEYVSAIKKNIVTFGVGPAGTGKTYLAVCLAVAAYKGKEVEKIILTRPAVEAGEKLGFLPGDLQTKVDPYLRPLYDALQEMFGLETYAKLMEKGAIEVAPLAYMRGRTLSNAFVILDEAQNATREQMKMFLTRLGEGSRMVITGDLTQTDLPEGKTSGLKQAVSILKGVEEIAVCTLTEKDVVRHPLVMRIVRAYERDEAAKTGGKQTYGKSKGERK